MDMSIRFPGLGIEFEYVIRSFRINRLEISIYGLLAAAGMLIGLAFMLLEAKRAKENLNQCLMTFIWSVLGGVIGARLFYAAFAWKLFKGDWLEVFRIDHGGLSIYGAILGAVIAVYLYCCVRKVIFAKMADYAAIALVTGQMIGRWGDFFNRESFGEYTDWMFGMQLPLASVRTSEVTSLMRENLVTMDGVSYVQVHPTFLYESIWCGLLLLVLLAYMRRKKFHGEIFMRYLAGYGFGRFFIEYLRTDNVVIRGVGISVSMLISATLFCVFGTMAAIERSMMKKREKLRKSRNETYYEEEHLSPEEEAREAIELASKLGKGATLEEKVEEITESENEVGEKSTSEDAAEQVSQSAAFDDMEKE